MIHVPILLHWDDAFEFPPSVYESDCFPVALPINYIAKFWVFEDIMVEKFAYLLLEVKLNIFLYV